MPQSRDELAPQSSLKGEIHFNFSESHVVISLLFQTCWEALNQTTDRTVKCAFLDGDALGRCGHGADLLVRKPLFFHLTLVWGHVLVPVVAKSSLAQEDLECKQQELGPWLPGLGGRLAGGAREERLGAPEVSGGRWGSGQMDEPVYLEMNFTGMRSSPHLFLAHSILNSCSQFSSKMSLLRYFFDFSISIGVH